MITADGARVVSADHAASNGIIHVIDSVMFPVPTQDIVSFLTSMGEFFSTLITAVKDAGLVDTLQGKHSTLLSAEGLPFKSSILHLLKYACIPMLSANKAAHFGFETPRRCYQKSKTGVSVAP